MIDLSGQVTQAEFGAMVGISQPAVSDLLSRGVLTAGAPVGRWLLEYCGNQREVAAGRSGDGDLNLVVERARLARAQSEKIEMANAVTRQELAPRTLLIDVLARTASKVCGLLESIVPSMRRRGGYSAEDLKAVADIIAKARNEIAAMRLPDVMGSDADDGVDDLEDAA